MLEYPDGCIPDRVGLDRVACQPVRLRTMTSVDQARLDRRDQARETVAGDFLEPGVPVILDGGSDTQPYRVAWSMPRSSWVGTDSAASQVSLIRA